MFKNLKAYIKDVIDFYDNKDKMPLYIYLGLNLFVIVCAVLEVIRGDLNNFLLCILTLLLFNIPYFVDRKLKLEMPKLFDIIILLFIFCAEILGEIQNFYGIFPDWDTMLHTINGFLAAAIGFSLIDILNTSERFSWQMTPIFVALVSFCFSMTVGVVWEFFEFGCDNFLNKDMQKDTIVKRINSVTLDKTNSNKPITIDNINKTIIYYNNNKKEIINNGYLDIGLIDTMNDLLVNFVGAIIFSILGFFYIKNRDKYQLTEKFIVRKKVT